MLPYRGKHQRFVPGNRMYAVLRCFRCIGHLDHYPVRRLLLAEYRPRRLGPECSEITRSVMFLVNYRLARAGVVHAIQKRLALIFCILANKVTEGPAHDRLSFFLAKGAE